MLLSFTKEVELCRAVISDRSASNLLGVMIDLVPSHQ